VPFEVSYNEIIFYMLGKERLMINNEKRKGVVVQSVVRALEILRCFEKEPLLGISEIAEYMELSKSTVYGLVNTLTSYGYLEQLPQSKKYKLGMKLFEQGNLVQRRMDIRSEARPWCQLLSDKYKTTAHLATHSDGNIIYIDKVDNTDSVVIYSQVGKRAPMHCTGVGKALLAYLPEDYLDRFIFSHALVRMTDKTITSRDDLLEELKKIREQGYSVDYEEIEPGLRCIAAPIFDHQDNASMAISISFPYGRLKDIDWDEAVRDVQYYARQISERIGHTY